MKKITIFPKGTKVTGSYDIEADCLYINFGEPRPAIGIDRGMDGVIVFFDEGNKEVVGLTVLGVKHRVEEYLRDLEQRKPIS